MRSRKETTKAPREGGRGTELHPPRVFIAVDSEFTADGIKSYLSCHGCCVVGVELREEALLDRVKELSPEILVLKVRRPQLRRKGFLSQFRQLPGTAVILWVSKTDLECLPQLIKDGVRGCVLRTSPRAHLVEAIQAVRRQELYFSPGVIEFLGKRTLKELQQATGLQNLTEQERRVVTLLCGGQSNKELADALGMDLRAVEGCRARLQVKLDIDNVAELTKFALKHCLTSFD